MLLESLKSRFDGISCNIFYFWFQGIRRDENWMKLSVEDRSTILHGVLDSDVFPNEFLEREIPPTPENDLVPENQVDDKVNDEQEENQAPEEQVYIRYDLHHYASRAYV